MMALLLAAGAALPPGPVDFTALDMRIEPKGHRFFVELPMTTVEHGATPRDFPEPSRLIARHVPGRTGARGSAISQQYFAIT